MAEPVARVRIGGMGREWLPGLLSPDAPPGSADELFAIMTDVHPAGFRAMAHSFAATDLRDALPGIAAPTLVVHGERDLRSPVPVGEEPAARIPGARFVVVPGAGHMVNVEAAGAFTAELVGFLDGLEADSLAH